MSDEHYSTATTSGRICATCCQSWPCPTYSERQFATLRAEVERLTGELDNIRLALIPCSYQGSTVEQVERAVAEISAWSAREYQTQQRAERAEAEVARLTKERDDAINSGLGYVSQWESLVQRAEAAEHLSEQRKRLALKIAHERKDARQQVRAQAEQIKRLREKVKRLQGELPHDAGCKADDMNALDTEQCEICMTLADFGITEDDLAAAAPSPGGHEERRRWTPETCRYHKVSPVPGCKTCWPNHPAPGSGGSA
jgi:hypothetical protein